ncbi:MAG: type II toxin-antitoxin system RelE/ParE family toxin [Acutalibacteraceae bacterium]|nr:type II toxin-antitoxin system RelE/ParE family toxin [Acutalibacteraceae bacterium]
MNKYSVLISPKAYQDLDGIYKYITDSLEAPNTAEKLISQIEQRILSLELFPHRGTLRKTGIYSNGKYRQLFFKNYTIIYRINESNHQIIIVTICYSHRLF